MKSFSKSNAQVCSPKLLVVNKCLNLENEIARDLQNRLGVVTLGHFCVTISMLLIRTCVTTRRRNVQILIPLKNLMMSVNSILFSSIMSR